MSCRRGKLWELYVSYQHYSIVTLRYAPIPVLVNSPSLTFMQNQMEMGNVGMMTRRDRMTRIHSQMPRCGDFTPREREISNGSLLY